jgi:hypothetical protein
MLKEMEQDNSGKPGKNRLQHDTNLRGAPTFADLGITNTPSHRWQLDADRPEEQFSLPV